MLNAKHLNMIMIGAEDEYGLCSVKQKCRTEVATRAAVLFLQHHCFGVIVWVALTFLKPSTATAVLAMIELREPDLGASSSNSSPLCLGS